MANRVIVRIHEAVGCLNSASNSPPGDLALSRGGLSFGVSVHFVTSINLINLQDGVLLKHLRYQECLEGREGNSFEERNIGFRGGIFCIWFMHLLLHAPFGG